jgi:hypothetical protein
MNAEQVARIVEAIRPLLAGKPPPVQGAALADLLAIWLAGHFADTTGDTTRLRETLLKEHVKAVRALIPENEKAIRKWSA